jgi:hypothetical protein
MEWTKLTVAVGDVGQAPKFEDLAQTEGTDRDGEPTGEADTVVLGGAAWDGDEAGGSSYLRARITLDAAPDLAH